MALVLLSNAPVAASARGNTAGRASTPRTTSSTAAPPPRGTALTPRGTRQRLPPSRASQASSTSADPTTLRPLPQTAAEMVAQCATCIRLAASEEGGAHRRQRLEILLPINQRR